MGGPAPRAARRGLYGGDVRRSPNGLSAPRQRQRATTQNIQGQRSLAEVIPLQGGVPIKAGDVTIGGVGLSGAPKGGPQEEACGKAGIDKVADQLK